ncbi:NAD-dependent glutamate dehydrogenase [Rhizophagus irregularis]|uniref:NAD-specific glutamate dehydrogenase n=4 Tax=Rhizophagus irregularis TaxID=588596 RepID=A0A2I1H9L6_9GLOM|nr:glutamate dehydrogenase (NAD(+)) [Rhizophagus irregularis DAOM 197198w]PKC01063.1 NAD-dependent glutamate dehydrogenase [Rhizophagus irregularis]GBC40087.1 NAD+ dependent glutamate dehydrogenase, putative [Rhizophagus irregularis DAOM 181602=DAOM 197198]PKC60240.1 NAD-dependent glutamate dehydrogenase [Rhizophagus irregularis]PKY26084.1 NAD-dependent glutamate dehydrogenase [Rhizophagus irregularis]
MVERFRGVPGLFMPTNSIVKDSSGYSDNIFEGKADQMLKVCEYLEEKGFIPKDLVRHEVSWFYGNLGIDDMYFTMENIDTIANHILALYGAKIYAYTKNQQSELDINLERETDEAAVYIHTSRPGISQLTGPQHERRIDLNYLDVSNTTNAYRLESYRSRGNVSPSVNAQIRCYFVAKCDFVKSNPSPDEETDIRLVGDRTFLEKATENTLEIYQNVMKAVLKRTGPVIEMFEVEGSRERRLVIGYRQRSTQSFFSAMSDLYHFYELYSTRKYVEQFSNGVTVMSLYLNPLPSSKSSPIEHSIHQVIKEASLIYCLPTTPFQHFFQSGKLSVQETIYGYVGWIFAQHFLNRLGNEYVSLSNILDQNDPVHAEVLNKIKKRLRSDAFTREYILDIIKMYPDLIHLLYINFALTHYVNPRAAALEPTLSFQRIQTDVVLNDDELLDKIKKTTSNVHEFMVFESFLIFNKHVLKTNFYQPTKVALSFRLNPAFLPSIEYPSKLYGMFLVIGSEFRGFHLRFRDVARGGIRIIRSRNKESYSINLRSLFDENYALAATQQRKNKDIPEGGSKGTILLDISQQDKDRVAFEKYVDSILDLLIPGTTPGIKEKIVDLYNKPEILFFGPDEGTANFVDWASAHARKRGASFWKAFTTGKSQSMGGIPHDLYGMTTRSVHQYVLGIYRKFGLKESKISKFQTGGPDGDLGSNEIKISKDRTVAIVDGSGVICDPEGIDRSELKRLAQNRLTVSRFEASKLSPNGFKVLIDEQNIKLPSGQAVEDGLLFRNNFHLMNLVSAELFVPCGGRPEAVDLSNVNLLLDKNGKPRFKYIVEGANLFFTQEARVRLEQAGAIIFKDASANKGGVTSSSLEVLAALALTDEEFEKNMQVHDNIIPAFYNEYIKEVHRVIEKNAELEFECIWREHRRTGKPRSIISDELSLAIVDLNENMQQSSLWSNEPLRKTVLRDAFPQLLLDRLGLDTLLERVPEPYVKAIFGSYLASKFVYKYGTNPSQFAFFEFMSPFFSKINDQFS